MMILRINFMCLALASITCAVSVYKRKTINLKPRADYSPPSYSGGAGGGGGGGGEGSAGTHGPSSEGNLYYYYYPVQNHAGYPTTAGRDDDFNSILVLFIPLLLLGGLALLTIPFFNGGIIINTGTTRRRSNNDQSDPSFNDPVSEIRHEVNRLFTIYLNAVESEQCAERIFCELGSYASYVSGKGLIFRLVDFFDVIPDIFKMRFRVMKKAALNGKDVSVCKKYLCHRPKLIGRS